MGLLDNMKARIGPAKEKVSDLAQRHGGTIGQRLDKAAKVVDEKTKGKYSDKIHAGTDKAKDAMDRLAHKGGTGPETRTAPEAGASPEPGTGTAPGGASAPTPPEGPPPTS
ncbi:antitoxin [Streptomyces sp. NPDC001292]|uniref:antitoxin n=1 Tax=Streptomyces sp. NPDC001292 TaxID=3364558 RepID=UPI0036910D5D